LITGFIFASGDSPQIVLHVHRSLTVAARSRNLTELY